MELTVGSVIGSSNADHVILITGIHEDPENGESTVDGVSYKRGRPNLKSGWAFMCDLHAWYWDLV